MAASAMVPEVLLPSPISGTRRPLRPSCRCFMLRSGMWIGAKHIARDALVLVAAAAIPLSCASGTTPVPDEAGAGVLGRALEAARDRAPRPRGALVVRLAFGLDADLDLYVTDPLEETVYFANTPARSGGALDADRTCDDAGVGEARVETVVFGQPPPGRYRVGVDHPRECPGFAGPAPFAIELEHEGGRTVRTGVSTPRRFDPIVLEVELR